MLDPKCIIGLAFILPFLLYLVGRILRKLEVGGLGIKDLSLFNKSLLGKWRWGFATEPDNLWCRVIKSKYMGNNPIRESLWWKDIQSSSCDEGGDWFELGIQKALRGGNNPSGCLCDKYHRLFNLSKLNYDFVKDCAEWSKECGGGSLDCGGV